jgi:hypothetical protein
VRSMRLRRSFVVGKFVVAPCWNYKFMGLFSPDPSDELLRWLCCTLKELLRSYGSCKFLQILQSPASSYRSYELLRILQILQILQCSSNSNYCCVYIGDLCPTKFKKNQAFNHAFNHRYLYFQQGCCNSSNSSLERRHLLHDHSVESARRGRITGLASSSAFYVWLFPLDQLS